MQFHELGLRLWNLGLSIVKRWEWGREWEMVRKTNHAEAIKKDKLLTYFLLDRELYQEPSSETFIWHDSFIEYKKWYKSWH